MIHPCAPVWKKVGKVHEHVTEWACKVCDFRSTDSDEVTKHIWHEERS